MPTKNIFVLLCSLLLMVGCAHSKPALKTVDRVDLNTFMGTWYVIASIPTPIETKAYNATEHYELLSNGTIKTTFTFNQASFDGPIKRYNPRGFVIDQIHNSTWKMQFIWPFKAEYLITYLNKDYTQTIIGRTNRDFFWIMARTPHIPEDQYERLLDIVKNQGYDMNKVRRVPQH